MYHASETQPLSTLRAFFLHFFPFLPFFSLYYTDCYRFFLHMQRWGIIRKRRGNLNVGSNSTGSQLFEARRAAHHAMSLALDMPVKNLTAIRSGNPLHFILFLVYWSAWQTV